MKFISKYLDQIRKCKETLVRFDNRVDSRIRYYHFQELALNSNNIGVSSCLYADIPVIISLTTYGLRLQEVYITLESLLHQTLQPNKIVLSLSDKYNNSFLLPEILKKQTDRGVELLFCKDIRSYTKLLPVLYKYPNAIIITVDDDMIYPCDFVEKLVKSYKEDNSKVHFYYGHTISLDDNGKPTSYDEWVKSPASGSSLFNLPTGVDGILYPPNCFHDDVFNETLFMDLCPFADDLWFKAMTLMKGYSCNVVPRLRNPRDEFLCINPDNIESLANVNRRGRQNDIQSKRLFEKYDLRSFFEY